MQGRGLLVGVAGGTAGALAPEDREGGDHLATKRGSAQHVEARRVESGLVEWSRAESTDAAFPCSPAPAHAPAHACVHACITCMQITCSSQKSPMPISPKTKPYAPPHASSMLSHVIARSWLISVTVGCSRSW